MKRGLVVAVVIVLVLLVVWWQRGGDASRTAKAPSAASTREAPRAVKGPRDAQLPVGDPRRGTRRVAGRAVVNGLPIAAASVWIEPYLMQHQVLAEVTTGADGAFVLDGLPAGKYALAASKPDLVGRRIEVDLRTSDQEDVVVRLGGCERALFGIVMDASGAPIAGARVAARDGHLDGAGLATTRADGRFRICLANVQATLDVRAEGYASEQRELRPGAAAEDFVLRPEAVLAGVTRDASGASVPFAFVLVEPDRGTGGRTALGGSAVSGADGAFELRGLGAGDYRASARADGMATASRVDASIELGAANHVELVLQPAGPVRGRAVLATGGPASDVEIVWLHHSAHRTVARTDATGAFTLDGAAYGDGVFFATGYAAPGARTVGAEPVELVLRPLDTVTLRGRVVLDRARPVADARLVAHGMVVYDRGRTRDDGTFEVEHFPGRTSWVAESDVLALASEPLELDLKPGETRDGIELVLVPRGAVHGSVVDDRGQPIAGAAVTLRPAGEARSAYEGNRVPGQAVTGSMGAFSVSLLPAGDYTVEVALAHKGLELVRGPRTVTLAAGATVSDVHLVVAVRRVTFAGQVVDEAGAPVPDAGLELRAGGGAQVRHADEAGRFRIESLEAARYALVARGTPGTETVLDRIEPGDNLRIQLVGSGRLRLACEPAGATVNVYPSSGAVMSSACGRVIARVPAGPVVRARRPRARRNAGRDGDRVGGRAARGDARARSGRRSRRRAARHA